jgi:hypothetical protein
MARSRKKLAHDKKFIETYYKLFLRRWIFIEVKRNVFIRIQCDICDFFIFIAIDSRSAASVTQPQASHVCKVTKKIFREYGYVPGTLIYCHVVCVTIDGVWIGELTTYNS